MGRENRCETEYDDGMTSSTRQAIRMEERHDATQRHRGRGNERTPRDGRAKPIELAPKSVRAVFTSSPQKEHT